MHKFIKTNSKSKLPLGYRLQAKRLDYTRSEFTRAIKYPISGDLDLEEELSKRIESDIVNLVGTLNPDEYFNPDYNNNYTVLDFYLDSIRLGFIFQPSTANLLNFIERYEFKRTSFDKVFESITNAVLKEKILSKKLEKELLKSCVKNTSTVASIHKKFLEVFKKDHQNDPDVLDIVSRLSKNILKLDAKERKKLILKEFYIPNNQDESAKFKYTAYPIKELDADFDSHIFNVIERNFELCKRIDSSVLDEDIIGIGNEGSALSNFLNIFIKQLQQDQEDIYINSLSTISKNFKDRDPVILEKINQLKERAKKVKNPQLTNNWSDYRKVLAGKIKSSYTTYKKRRLEIVEQLKNQVSELNTIQSNSKSIELEQISSNLVLLNQEILSTFEQTNDINTNTYDLYINLLGELRTLTNYELQSNPLFKENVKNYLLGKDRATSKNKKSEPEMNFKDLFINLSKKNLKIPAFFGDRKSERFEKYKNSVNSFKKGVNLIDKIEEELLKKPILDITDEYYLKQIDKLITLTPRVTTQEKINLLNDIFIKTFGKIPNFEREVAFKNRFSRNKKTIELETLPLINKDSLELLEIYKKLNSDLTFNGKKIQQVVEELELKKMALSWLINTHLTSEGTVDLDLDETIFTHFGKAETFVKFFGKSLNKYQLEKFLSTCIFSELKGFLSTISLENFTSRNIVQLVDSEEKFILTTLKSDNKRKSIIQFTSLPTISELENTGNVIEYKEKDIEKSKLTNKKLINPMYIKTSKYQMQFLDWFYDGSQKNKKNVSIERKSPAISLEKEIEVKWDFKLGTVVLKKKDQKVYFIQPFLLSSTSDKEKEGGLKDKLIARKTYLGVDVGEFGLAYTICIPSEGKVIETGFIYDHSYRKLREEVEALVATQKKGTFNIQSTKIARMRKHIIGSLRSRLHSLAIKHDAKLVFEFNISAFEEGSNKIRKIYDSIKKSDVGIKTDLEVSNVWGKIMYPVGSQISAYGTSQLCSNCNKSVLQLESKTSIDSIENISNGISRVKLSDGSYIHIYEKRSTSEEVKDINFLKSKAGEFARPPLESEASKLYLGKKIDQDTWRKNRGNSAIFICPFCTHVSDADIQASLNIAVRGYLKDQKKSKKEANEENSLNTISLNEISDFMRSKFKPIELEI